MQREHWVTTNVYMDAVKVSIPVSYITFEANCRLQKKLDDKLHARGQ